jgi:hypothetical protein
LEADPAAPREPALRQTARARAGQPGHLRVSGCDGSRWIACGFSGVSSAYALKAGKELARCSWTPRPSPTIRPSCSSARSPARSSGTSSTPERSASASCGRPARPVRSVTVPMTERGSGSTRAKASGIARSIALLPPDEGPAGTLARAMRYAVFGAGSG